MISIFDCASQNKRNVEKKGRARVLVRLSLEIFSSVGVSQEADVHSTEKIESKTKQ